MSVSLCNPTVFLSRSPSPPASTIAFAANLQCSSRNLLFRRRNSWNSGLQSTSASNKCGFGPWRLAVSCKATEITENEFGGEVLKSDSPVLVEFIANWCGPCRLISPVVDWASEVQVEEMLRKNRENSRIDRPPFNTWTFTWEYKGKLKVVKIDHDTNPKLIEEYKVYGLPTLILFKNGQVVPRSRREGAMTRVKLKEYLDPLLESVAAA